MTDRKSPIPFDQNPIIAAKRVLKVIPDKYKPKMEWMLNDFQYKAPEQWEECWMRLNEYLTDILLDEQWKRDVVKAFRLEE